MSAITLVVSSGVCEWTAARFFAGFLRRPVRFLFVITEHLRNQSKGNTTADLGNRFRSCNFSRNVAVAEFTVFRPRGRDAGHAGVGNELAHVLVGVNDDAEIHTVDGGVAVGDVDPALKILGVAEAWASFTASRERLSQLITSALEVTLFSISSLTSVGIFGPVTLSR
jgi:hypothetical protein